MPRIIIHTIAPIISMQGSANRAYAMFAPASERTTTATMMAAQPHIIFIECFMWTTVRRVHGRGFRSLPQSVAENYGLSTAHVEPYV